MHLKHPNAPARGGARAARGLPPLSALAASLLLAAIVTACSSQAAPGGGAPPAPEVSVASVLTRPVHQWDEFTGRVAAGVPLASIPQGGTLAGRVGDEAVLLARLDDGVRAPRVQAPARTPHRPRGRARKPCCPRLRCASARAARTRARAARGRCAG